MATDDLLDYAVSFNPLMDKKMRIITVGYCHSGRTTLLSSIFEQWTCSNFFYDLKNHISDAFRISYFKPQSTLYQGQNHYDFNHNPILFEKEPSNTFFRDILTKISSKFHEIKFSGFDLDFLNTTTSRLAFTKNDILFKNEKQSFIDRIFGKFEKLVKNNQIKITSRELFNNLLKTKSRLDSEHNQKYHKYLLDASSRCNTWFNKIMDLMSILLFEITKQHTFVKVFIWTIVSIIWLSNFLDKCNLDVKAI